MLTRIHIRKFKRFVDASIDLGKAVVLIGPNNSGKTTVLQALALWDIGVRRWNEKRRGKPSPEKRPGVTINRRDLVSIPVPHANLLWRDLHVRDTTSVEKGDKRSTRTENVRVEIVVEGISSDVPWSCGLEFDYANEESFYCRPVRTGDGDERMPVPEATQHIRVAFLPPMSGLADREFAREPGEISVLIGQGQTAQVLRNLCYRIFEARDGQWDRLAKHIRELFGVTLLEPVYTPERAEISMAYLDERENKLDLSSSGRGLQQTLLLLAYLYANPQSALLLDEPDAHLEILRQRQTYNLLTQVAENQGSQVIAASHSEVVLGEAAGRDTVIAFVGKPHRIDDKGSQVLKSLRDIGFDQYYQAEQTGWVLYLESSTDLSVLRTFAVMLDHPSQKDLDRPFVHYVETNLPQRAREHFYGLREAKSDLLGVAIFDRLEKELQTGPLEETMWRRREIENYFCVEDVLLSYARRDQPDDLFGRAESARREAAMREAIAEVIRALRTLNRPEPWSPDIKASDEFLEPLFKAFFQKLNLPLQLRKSEYHVLASFLPKDRIDPEIREKLDLVHNMATRAKPRTEQG